MTDEQVPPRHRIEAARELRQVAGSDPANPSSEDKVIIRIDFGGDDKLVVEATPCPLELASSDEGEVR